MNPGGEPERDDTGLPPVDIEIPDDARELDRDVQAYYRELRAERRSRRRRRLHVGLTRDGVILPLLACCLIFALITGTLLTVFTATSDQNLVTPPPRGANPSRTSSQPSTSPPLVGPGLSGTTAHLSHARLLVNHQSYYLDGLVGTLLVLIPGHCHCITAVSRLTEIGDGTRGGTVLVGTPATITEARRLQSQLNPSVSTNVLAGLDSQSVLQKDVRAVGLTAVVITASPTASGAQPMAYASNVTSSDLSSRDSRLSVALLRALAQALEG